MKPTAKRKGGIPLDELLASHAAGITIDTTRTTRTPPKTTRNKAPGRVLDNRMNPSSASLIQSALSWKTTAQRAILGVRNIHHRGGVRIAVVNDGDSRCAESNTCVLQPVERVEIDWRVADVVER